MALIAGDSYQVVSYREVATPAPDCHALPAHCSICDHYNSLSDKDHVFSEDYLLNLLYPTISNRSWKGRGLVTAGSLGEVKCH